MHEALKATDRGGYSEGESETLHQAPEGVMECEFAFKGKYQHKRLLTHARTQEAFFFERAAVHAGFHQREVLKTRQAGSSLLLSTATADMI